MKKFTEKQIKYYQKRARNSWRKNGWKGTADKDILMLPGVALSLARESDKTGWVTNDKEILMLKDVAIWHAMESFATGWITNEKDILTIPGVAGYMATFSAAWNTTDLDILMLREEKRYPGDERRCKYVYEILHEKAKLPEELRVVCELIKNSE